MIKSPRVIIFGRDNRASGGAARRGGFILLAVVMAMSLSLVGCDRYGLGHDRPDDGSTPDPNANPLAGRWGGYITWNSYTPATLERGENELICISGNGLPIRAVIEMLLTPYPDGTGVASATVGGTSCLIDEDGAGNLTSVWMESPEYTDDFSGPMTWKDRTMEISLAGGQVLRGTRPPDEGTITGTIVTTMDQGVLVGEWFAHQE